MLFHGVTISFQLTSWVTVKVHRAVISLWRGAEKTVCIQIHVVINMVLMNFYSRCNATLWWCFKNITDKSEDAVIAAYQQHNQDFIYANRTD